SGSVRHAARQCAHRHCHLRRGRIHRFCHRRRNRRQSFRYWSSSMSLKDRYDLVIFDWAGTMVDFGSEAPVLALIEAYEAEGVTISAAAARQDMGKAKRDHVNGLMAIPEVAAVWQAKFDRPSNAEDVERIMVRLGPLMREHAERASTLIAGARAT